MQRIFSLTTWTPVQRKWLDRLAKQLHHEVVLDQQFVNRAFATDGGAKRLDKPCSAASWITCWKRWLAGCGRMRPDLTPQSSMLC
jgi:hypothetical protein